jgi:Uri superfamily endonuclease
MRGVYVLLISVYKNLQLKIGSLGRIRFDKGKYAYVGSAQNNLEKRIQRHMSKNKNKFWHIDYLLDSKFTKILDVFYTKSGNSEECRIANKLGKTELPVLNFGCSDCNCKSHLFKIRNSDVILRLGLEEL